jgi:Flp pilus assembly pilin Flp
MKHLTALCKLLKNDKGATMIEYSLMLTFIAMVAFLAIQNFGTSVNALFTVP